MDSRPLRTAIARLKPVQRKLGRNISISGLPRRRTVNGSVWAVTMIRDEADVIGHTIRHLLRQGIAAVIVADNLSTDATPVIVAGLATEYPGRVFLGKDSWSEYHQGRKMSHLANLARLAGADWIIPFDADEFWFAETRTVAEFLRSAEGPVVEAAVRDAHATSAQGIDLDDPSAVVRLPSEQTSRKVAIRPRRWVWIDDGNHTALDLGRATTAGLRIAHLPHRSFEQLERKVTQGADAISRTRGVPSDHGNHWRSAAAQSREARLEAWHREVAETRGDIVTTPHRWRTWSDR